MKSGFAIVHRITQAEFNIDFGASLSAGFIEIVDSQGQPTGDIYMTGLTGAPAVQINESTAYHRVAQGSITAAHVVYDVDGVHAAEVDPTNIAQCHRILGLAHTSVTNGQEVQIIGFGEYTLTTGLSSGDIYLTSGATLTYTPPTSGIFVKLGFISNSSKIIVNIEHPIVFA